MTVEPVDQTPIKESPEDRQAKDDEKNGDSGFSAATNALHAAKEVFDQIESTESEN